MRVETRRPKPPTRLAAAAVALVTIGAVHAAAQSESAEDPSVALEVTEENARSIEAYNAAIIAAREGRLVESIGKLEAFIAAEPPEALKLKATEQLGLIRAERRKQHVVEFNEAVKLLKGRELERAEALLAGILADGPTEKMRRSVTKQLGIIERAKPRRDLIVDDAPAADDTGPKKRKKRKKDRGD